MSDAEMADTPSFPIRRQCPSVLPPEYEPARDKGISRVKLPNGRLAWIITSYENARLVLADPRFSANKMHPDFPKLSPNGLDKLKYFAPFLVNLDGAEHAQARKAIINEFSASRVAALRPRIQHIVDSIVETILEQLAKPVDLVRSLSYPTALQVQELLLGIPADDLATVRQNTEDLLLRTGTKDEEAGAAAKLHQHLDGVLAGKEDRLGDDLVSRQILRHRTEKGHVDRFGLTSLVQLLAVGGYNSAATVTSLGVLTLLTHADQLKVILKDPSRMSGAVDELLRYFSVNDASPLRLALVDVQIGETVIRAGDGVAVPLLPANRDPGMYPDPNDLDLLREPRARHIAFGYGPHRCLAHSLVPAQLEIVFTTLFRRIPDLRLALDEKELSFKYHSQTFGPAELPVTW